MKHWRRAHANGWTVEVRLGVDGQFHHRTYESDVIPSDFATSKVGLATAQASADLKVPHHECKCPAWKEW